MKDDPGDLVIEKLPALSQLIRDLPQKPLFRVDEVAKFFQVSAKTIYTWCELGLLLSVNLNGGTLRVLRDSVIDLLKKRIVEKTMG